jgi:hypothetical protein
MGANYTHLEIESSRLHTPTLDVLIIGMIGKGLLEERRQLRIKPDKLEPKLNQVRKFR